MINDEEHEWLTNTETKDEHSLSEDITPSYGPSAGTELEHNLLPTLEGKRVLDVGCGSGQCSIWLSQQGAKVTGVDSSTEQLTYARRLADQYDASVTFVEDSAKDLKSIESGVFDIAFSSYALQWTDDLKSCFSEVNRILDSTGIFVFSLPHPMYQIINPNTHIVEKSYFSTGAQIERIEETEHDIVTYRRTVGEIYNKILDTGFIVDTMLEPGSSDPRDYDKSRWEFQPSLLSKVPSTIIFKAYVE